MSPDYYLNNTTFIETFANEFFKNQGIPSFKIMKDQITKQLSI